MTFAFATPGPDLSKSMQDSWKGAASSLTALLCAWQRGMIFSLQNTLTLSLIPLSCLSEKEMSDDLQPRTVYFDELKIGMSETIRRVVSKDDIRAFAELSRDRNPVHLDEDYAKKTPFGGCIAHGIFSAALISAVIGMRLPGPGTIYMKQDLQFLAPVKVGDTVEVTVAVAQLVPEKGRAVLSCVCKVGETEVLKGEALVKAPKRPA